MHPEGPSSGSPAAKRTLSLTCCSQKTSPLTLMQVRGQMCIQVTTVITFGFHSPFPLPGGLEPRAVGFRFLLRLLLRALMQVRRTISTTERKQRHQFKRGGVRRYPDAVGDVMVRGSYQVRFSAPLLQLLLSRFFRLLLVFHLHQEKQTEFISSI